MKEFTFSCHPALEPFATNIQARNSIFAALPDRTVTAGILDIHLETAGPRIPGNTTRVRFQGLALGRRFAVQQRKVT
ncbi:hypothetical protein ACFS3C_05620 [Azotobacter vinelandii]